MTMTIGRRVTAGAASILVLGLAIAGPAWAQDSAADTRLRRLEAEVRALQRKVFPGDGKVFAPEITAPAAATGTATPASTPVTDLLARMDAIETQIQRLTAQNEQNSNRIAQIEARLGPAPAAAVPAVTAPVTAPATTAVPTGTAPAPQTILPSATTPTPAPATATPAPSTAVPAPAATTPRPAATTPTATRPAAPSAARVAAVRAIEKPATSDPGDDEYSYGFRLWEAKFYPEAAQQLKLFVDKYPRHSRISFGRNLLGRALLDDGKPREAAAWFLQNFQADKAGARAPDSLLYLAVAMKQLQDNSRTCIALAEFGETYPAESAGRLKTVYDATRSGVKCTR